MSAARVKGKEHNEFSELHIFLEPRRQAWGGGDERGLPKKTGRAKRRWAERRESGEREREEEGEKMLCGNGVCHLVVAAGCCCGSGRQMDHEYCLDKVQPDALHLLCLRFSS